MCYPMNEFVACCVFLYVHSHIIATLLLSICHCVYVQVYMLATILLPSLLLLQDNRYGLSDDRLSDFLMKIYLCCFPMLHFCPFSPTLILITVTMSY